MRSWGGGGCREIVNPATESGIAEVPMASQDDVDEAVNGATAVAEIYGATDQYTRSRVLARCADVVRQHAESLAPLITHETGKRLIESQAEVALAADFFEWFAHAVAGLTGDMYSIGTRRFHVTHKPVGVVAAISPWNFPLSIPARKIAAALAAGCPVIFKPSELAPLSGLRLAALVSAELQHMNLPDAALAALVGDSAIGQELVSHKAIRAVTFTGSTPVGRLVAQSASVHFARLVLELGGRAPFVVRADADVEAATDTLVVAKYRNNGASCIAANNIYVHTSLYRAFKQAFVRRSKELRVGNPLQRDKDLGPLINKTHVDRLAAAVDQASRDGADVCTLGRVPGSGYYFPPTIVELQQDQSIPLWTEEVFGPVAMFRPYDDDDELLAEVNSDDGGLGGYICGGTVDSAIKLAEKMAIGIIGINLGAPNTPAVPFGGIKSSGLGREGSRSGLHAFLEEQTIAVAQ